MRELFATEPGRAERYWLEVGGLKVDYSKNRITDETLALLMKLAREAGLPERMKQMFRGEKDQHHRKPRRAACGAAQPHQCADFWWTAKM